MMRPKGVRGLLERLRDLPLRTRIIGGALAGLLLVGVVAGGLLLSGGGGDGVSDAGGGGDADLLVDFGDDGGLPPEGDAAGAGDGGFGETEATLTVAQQVEATVAALNPEPTPTEEPTPDVAATLAAEVAASRGGEGWNGGSVNPLDAGGVLNPYLTERDRLYLAAMGEDLWVATQLYMRVTEVATLDYHQLEAPYIRERLSFIDGLLSALPDTGAGSLSSSGLNELVVSFVDYVDGGMASVRDGVRNLRAILSVFDAAGADTLDQLDGAQRAQVREHYLLIEGDMLGFYRIMSAYGCSACGELYRSPYILE